jgi:hypothetical protein
MWAKNFLPIGWTLDDQKCATFFASQAFQDASATKEEEDSVLLDSSLLG